MQRLRFLRVSSLIVKIVGCIFLLLGLFAGLSIIFGASPALSRWTGILVILIYGFVCFFFYFVSKIADILTKVIIDLETKDQK
jgi:hypothetical protein